MKYLDEITYQLDTIPHMNGYVYYAFQAMLFDILENENVKVDVDDVVTNIVAPAIKTKYGQTIGDITKLVDFRYNQPFIPHEMGDKMIITFRVGE